jgi:hypothetical protein
LYGEADRKGRHGGSFTRLRDRREDVAALAAPLSSPHLRLSPAAERQMLYVTRLLGGALVGLGLLFAAAFYDRYWRWRDCFNELGRCFDPCRKTSIWSSPASSGAASRPFSSASALC